MTHGRVGFFCSPSIKASGVLSFKAVNCRRLITPLLLLFVTLKKLLVRGASRDFARDHVTACRLLKWSPNREWLHWLEETEDR